MTAEEAIASKKHPARLGTIVVAAAEDGYVHALSLPKSQSPGRHGRASGRCPAGLRSADQRARSSPSASIHAQCAPAIRPAMTQENVGRPFAIVLDGKVISAPVIREPILGGTGQISAAISPLPKRMTSRFSCARARLPATAEPPSKSAPWAPGLGADSIAAGEVRRHDRSRRRHRLHPDFLWPLRHLFANLALLVNIALIVGVLVRSCKRR